LSTGNLVYNTGATGNTALNNTLANPNWTITRLSATTFSLNGSSGMELMLAAQHLRQR